jgi:Na+:H+ antiporter, NhaC family
MCTAWIAAQMPGMPAPDMPGLAVTLVFFTLIGLVSAQDSAAPDVSVYTEYILENFNITPWLFIPPLIVVTMVVMKIPAIPSLVAGVVQGGAAYLLFQKGSLSELSDVIHTGVVIESANSEMDQLFSRGGIESMYSVVALALVSLALGGIMDYTGMLHSIVLKLSRLLKRTGNMTITVIVTSILINIVAANQYLAVILPGQMYEECYRNKKLKLINLTRTLEAGGTLTAPLVPWNSSGIFVFVTLGVPVLQYVPFAVFCWLTPVVVIAYGFFNVTMQKTKSPVEEPRD